MLRPNFESMSYKEVKEHIKHYEDTIAFYAQHKKEEEHIEEAQGIVDAVTNAATVYADTNNLKNKERFDFFGVVFEAINVDSYTVGVPDQLFPYIKKTFPGNVKETLNYNTLKSLLKKVDSSIIEQLVASKGLLKKNTRSIKEV